MLCDRLGLERPILVGMSQGGRVALDFAFRHRDRVAGLILQGVPLSGFQPGPRGADAIPLADYARLVREGRLDEMKALWRRHPLMRDVRSEALLGAYDGRDLLAPSSPSSPLAEALGGIEVPALVVTGEQEIAWLQLVADAIAYGLPDARRVRLPGGHLCNISQPAPYNEMVAAFAAWIAR